MKTPTDIPNLGDHLVTILATADWTQRSPTHTSTGRELSLRFHHSDGLLEVKLGDTDYYLINPQGRMFPITKERRNDHQNT